MYGSRTNSASVTGGPIYEDTDIENGNPSSAVRCGVPHVSMPFVIDRKLIKSRRARIKSGTRTNGAVSNDPLRNRLVVPMLHISMLYRLCGTNQVLDSLRLSGNS